MCVGEWGERDREENRKERNDGVSNEREWGERDRRNEIKGTAEKVGQRGEDKMTQTLEQE